MASIRPRPSPSGTHYQVLFREGGRQRAVTYADVATAQRLVDLIARMGPTAALALIDSAERGSHADPTVTETVRAHVAGLDGITDGTRRDYESMIDRRIEGSTIGSIPTGLLTVEHIRSWLGDLEAAGLSSKTRRNHHALLSAALSTAIDRQVIGRNPARGIRIRITEADAGRVFLSAGELAVLVGGIPDSYRPLIVWLAGTGMRWGEATALQVGDIDLDAAVPVAFVRRAWKRSGRGAPTEVGAPKTRAGLRTVSLPPQVVAEVAPLLDGRPADALVFTTPRGNVVRHDHFYERVWKPTLDRLTARTDAEGNPVTPALSKRPRLHDLRHGHASALIQAGVPLPIIQRRLGHESIQTTVDTYGHMAPDHLAVSAHAISGYLVQAVPEIEG